MTTIFALMVLLVILLVTTITDLYDLHSYSLNNNIVNVYQTGARSV